jgi:NAD(P)-dependent dehydrogenase (short-subunit alcohol dehydrogenase family)
MCSQLANTRAVITGAGSGIDRAIAQELSARDAKVVACDGAVSLTRKCLRFAEQGQGASGLRP